MSYTVGTSYVLPTGHPNRPGEKLISPICLVYHYTGNYSLGADDIANAKYFGRPWEYENGRVEEKGTNNPFVYASAHYTVDQDSIQSCIPDDEIAHHVGSTNYTPLAWNKFMTTEAWRTLRRSKGLSAPTIFPNGYCIGIELCVNSGNDWDKTVELGIDLGTDIAMKYNIPLDMIVRHYDVTYKLCPANMIDAQIWADFKNKFEAVLMKKLGINKPKQLVVFDTYADMANALVYAYNLRCPIIASDLLTDEYANKFESLIKVGHENLKYPHSVLVSGSDRNQTVIQILKNVGVLV